MPAAIVRRAPAPANVVPPLSAAQAQDLAAGRFAWPLSGALLSQFQGPGDGIANGVMIAADPAGPVHAAAAGQVIYAGGPFPELGTLVLIRHADGWVTAYGHLGRIKVGLNEGVAQGQVIGFAQAEGTDPEPPEVYFEVRYAATPQTRALPVNPAWVLPR